MISFTVNEPPVPQPRARHAVNRGHAVTYQAPKAHPIHQFKFACREQAARAMDGQPPMLGPIRLTVTFLMPRPKYMMTAKYPNREMPPHIKRPDLDNLIKAVKDALSGVAWKDDCQVCSIIAEKAYTEKSESPCVMIVAEEDTK